MSDDMKTPLPTSHGSAGGMCLAERAHRESYQWDAFSLSDDPGVRAHLRRGFREGFMRGFNACAEMAPAVESLAGEVLRILCPEGHDPEELAQVQEAIRRILPPNATAQPRR